tara:strand:- start:27610 stop:29025 length:1416 start_codon:yes stop_codon:yes gene_type:complete
MILAAMAAIALVLVLRPLLGPDENGSNRAEYDTQIYKDQLAELERDAARGIITEEAASAARTEIARRLLAADEEAKVETTIEEPATGKATAIIVGITIPALTLSIYALTGSPHLQSQPGVETQAKAKAARKSNEPDLATIISELSARVKERPDDLEGWRLYARALAGIRRFADSVAAYQRATTLDPKNADLWSQLAEAQVSAAQGSVTPEARKSLEKALILEPREPRARYYVGLAAHQAGDIKQALKIWLQLEADSVANAPWRKVLGERIANTAKQNGVTSIALAKMRKTIRKSAVADSIDALAPGPTADDIKAAQEMSAKDRQEMIRGMVQSLAAKMEENPNNAEGWIRLGRSYEVLNEPAKSRDAYGKAAALKPNDLAVLTAYAGAIARAADQNAPLPPKLANVSERILSMQPTHGGALWFSGIAKFEAGDKMGAKERWTRLLAVLDPNGAQHAHVAERIKALEQPANP